MTELWMCQNGCHWHSDDHAGFDANQNPSICPVCGCSKIQRQNDDDKTFTRPTFPVSGNAGAKQAAALPTAGRRTDEEDPDPFAHTMNLPGERATEKPIAPAPKAVASAAEIGEETLQKPGKQGGPAPDKAHEKRDTDEVPSLDSPTEMKPRAPLKHIDVSQTRFPRLEGYEILKTLGRGGMGVVYKAKQIGLNRLVAIKMMVNGAFASQQDLARFHLEAEAVAEIQHENIVQIYEIGDQFGLPYFAMEYVEAGNLADQMNGKAWPALRAAELVEKLARAVFAAHQKGIIHRDLKPANILLGSRELLGSRGEGVGSRGSVMNLSDSLLPAPSPLLPKISDFGLAKRLDDDQGFTGAGDILGTPQYMAPEQAEGRLRDIGTGTDIHALGAILYDLLTGRPPFRGETVADTLNQVLFAEPTPPARLKPDIPRDLETICLKCLEKEPKNRYSTAEALADDLRRYQEGLPITARPTPAWERAWKWAKRRPAAAALVMLCLLGVVTLIAGGVVVAQLERSWRHLADQQRDLALKEKLEAEKQNHRAEQNFQLAVSAVDQMLTRVGQERLANQPRLSKVRRDLLLEALSFYESFLRKRGKEKSTRWGTARAQLRVGHIQEMLGEYKAAHSAYSAARRLLVEVAKENPGQAEYQLALGRTDAGRGIVLQALQDYAGAKRALTDAASEFSGLHRNNPGEEKYRYELAKTFNALGNLNVLKNGDPKQAAMSYRQAIKLLDDLEHDWPKLHYLEENARAHGNLAAALTKTDPDAAAKAHEKAREILKQFVKQFPEVSEYRKELGRTHLNLAQLSHQKNALAQAEEQYKKAEQYLAPLTEQFPNVVDFRYLLASTYNNWALLHRDSKDFGDAEAKRQRAQSHLRRLVEQSPKVEHFQQQLARICHDQAIYHSQENEKEKAAAAFDEALRLQQQLLDDSPARADYHLDLAKTHLDRGIAAAKQQDAAQAEKDYRRAVTILEDMTKAPPVPAGWRDSILRAHTNLALLLVYTKHHAEAEKHWKRLIALHQQQVTLSPNSLHAHAHLAAHHKILGQMLGKRDDRDNAQSHYQRAASLLARCIALVENDTALSTARKTELQNEYGAKSVAALRRAVELGWRDVNALRTDAVFAPVRDREDFQELLQSLQIKK